jgi:hypothetical protein
MEELVFKIRLTALWILAMIAFFAYRTIAISQGVTEVSVLSNRELVTVLLIMMLFALLTLLLPYKVNRSVNFVAGIVFAVLELIMLGDGLTAYPKAVFNMMTGAFIIFMAVIIWLSRSRKKAQE